MRKEVADALAKIGRPAVEPLIAIMKDTDLYDSAWAAWALGKMNMNHQTIDALFGEKYSTAYSNYHTLIKKGEKGTEICIIFALARYGDKLMAENLLNCNNKLLTEFAQEWARDNGYTTSTHPAKRDETMPKWGRN